MTRLLLLATCLVALLISACASGPVRRISKPTASIQQLDVNANGDWTIVLRIENFSSIAMRFEKVDVNISVNDQSAGLLQGSPNLVVTPESADITTLVMTPSSAARIAMADALSENRGVRYAMTGTLTAGPEDGNARAYELERNSALSPVPGLPGVLR